MVEAKRRRTRRVPISRDSVLIMLHSAPRLQLPSTNMAGACGCAVMLGAGSCSQHAPHAFQA